MLIGRDDKSRPTPSSPLLADRLTYPEALDFLSRQGRFAMKLGTERTRAILDRLGAPDRKLSGALIAGTNGKGSTGACLTSILRAAGHSVGFMPKPHLISYTERIEINGRPISEDEFVHTLGDLLPTLDEIAAEMGPATEFEMLTAMAVMFLAPRVDRLVCEVGLGGRLDATNALDLGVTAITNVDLDHQKYLGDTIGQIAHEKAAIIKDGNRAVTGCEGEALQIVEAQAARVSAQLWRLGREVSIESTSLGWDGHVLSVTGPGFVHRDLRHRDPRLVGEFLDRREQPRLVLVARFPDDLRPGRPLGHGLGEQQRDERTAEAENGREHQQTSGVETVRSERLIEAEQADDDRQDEHHGDVGDQEQHDALHESSGPAGFCCGRS